jgi:hypothetical protein
LVVNSLATLPAMAKNSGFPKPLASEIRIFKFGSAVGALARIPVVGPKCAAEHSAGKKV